LSTLRHPLEEERHFALVEGVPYPSKARSQSVFRSGTHAFIAAFGWALTFVGIQVTASVGGRLVLALVGIAISLFGILSILPAAFNKKAIWKA
jgi:hypothetical protein